MEQKTIFEELLEEAPAVREKHKKIVRAKHCVAREEWDEADALYEEVLAEFPEDNEALTGKILLNRKKAEAEKEQRRRSEKERARMEKKAVQEKKNAEKKAAQDAKKAEKAASRPPRKEKPLLHSKRFVVAAILIFVVVCAAVAAVFGIVAHRKSIEELYGDDASALTETRIAIYQKTDVL